MVDPWPPINYRKKLTKLLLQYDNNTNIDTILSDGNVNINITEKYDLKVTKTKAYAEEINYIDLVKTMRNPINYKQICINEPDLLKKCLLCKKYLTSSQWSMLLENYIKKLFNMEKAIDNISGDGYTIETQKRIEIKVSLGTNDTGGFNFVQLRPDHTLDYYLFLTYNIYEEEIGKLYWFLCKPEYLYKLLPEYGGYAHGTIEINGPITKENIYGKSHEYALRPNPLITSEKPNKLWNIMKEKFGTTEDIIKTII